MEKKIEVKSLKLHEVQHLDEKEKAVKEKEKAVKLQCWKFLQCKTSIHIHPRTPFYDLKVLSMEQSSMSKIINCVIGNWKNSLSSWNDIRIDMD